MSGMGGTPMADATPDMAMPDMHITGTSAVYFTITNAGDTADRLVKIETDAAEMATMHETKVVNEVAQMIPQPDGYEIPANGSVELKPGGKHIMLENLKRELKVGETVTLKLTFASGAVVDLVVPILVPAP
jgi:copper(I)-binding protein